MLLVLLAWGASPACAGTLTRVSWTVSNSEVGARGVAYSYAFTTATGAPINSVTMTVPQGTTGSPVVEAVYGLGAGTLALADDTLTYTVADATDVSSRTPIYLSVGGLTNTAVAGVYTSSVNTCGSQPATIDGGGSQPVSFGACSTAVAVTVEATLTLADAPMSGRPIRTALRSGGLPQASALLVRCNASDGCSLTVEAGLRRQWYASLPGRILDWIASAKVACTPPTWSDAVVTYLAIPSY
jgi:hypothetical protein